MNQREHLKEQFRDPEFRETFATEHLNSSIALQLAVIREQRKLKQEQVAAMAGTKQAGISRMESADYGRWNLQTLRKVAYLLGCRLKVSIETFGTLLDEAEQISRASLQRPSFEEDPAFAAAVTAVSANPVNWVRSKLIEYLDLDERDPERLAAWLSGRHLPPIGDEEEPWVWLARAVPKADTKRRMALIDALDTLLARVEKTAPREDRYLVNLFRLTAEVGEETFSQALHGRLHSIYEWVHTGHSHLRRAELSALRDSLIRHQTNVFYCDEWFRMIENDRHEILPGTAVEGFRGLCYIPTRPNLEIIAEGLKRLEARYWDELKYEELLRGVSNRFQLGVEAQDKLFELSIEKGWNDLLVKAWTKCFAASDQDIRALEDCAPQLRSGVVQSVVRTMAAAG